MCHHDAWLWMRCVFSPCVTSAFLDYTLRRTVAHRGIHDMLLDVQVGDGWMRGVTSVEP